MEAKSQKKITNWKEYNKSLIERGKTSIYITDEALDRWFHKGGRIGKGKTNVYGDETVILMHIIAEVYNLTYRQTQGFLEDTLSNMDRMDIKVPCYTIMSRRCNNEKFEKYMNEVRMLKQNNENIYISIDSTGIKISGEGEWKTKIHGKDKRREWKKLHIVIDSKSREILDFKMTDNKVHDGEIFGNLVNGLIKRGYNIAKCFADGAYNWNEHFNLLNRYGIEAMIPVPKNAVMSCDDDNESTMVITPRDKAILKIYDSGGLSEWKKNSGYHLRSIVENAFSRIKIRFGDELRVVREDVRQCRISVRMWILNFYTSLGMPIYR